MWNNPTDHVISWFCLQVLQYNAKAGRGTWSEMKVKLKRTRRYPAIVEANLPAVCFDIGKTNGGIHRNRKCNCLSFGLLPYCTLCFMNTSLISKKKYHRCCCRKLARARIYTMPSRSTLVIRIQLKRKNKSWENHHHHYRHH